MRKEGMTLPFGCPGSQSRNIQREAAPAAEAPRAEQVSRLSQWPVQIKLVPVNAPYFDGARLLIAADCTAYAYAAFHERFIKGHITLVGCPKLDSVDYSEKLTEIIRENNIKSVTVVRMEVPCCGGLELAAKKGAPAEREIYPVAGGHRDSGRPVGGRITKSLKKKKGRSTMKYVCTVCGWEYDESVGYPEGGIAPGTPWSEVPDDFECPLCGVGKDSFEEA